MAAPTYDRNRDPRGLNMAAYDAVAIEDSRVARWGRKGIEATGPEGGLDPGRHVGAHRAQQAAKSGFACGEKGALRTFGGVHWEIYHHLMGQSHQVPAHEERMPHGQPWLDEGVRWHL